MCKGCSYQIKKGSDLRYFFTLRFINGIVGDNNLVSNVIYSVKPKTLTEKKLEKQFSLHINWICVSAFVLLTVLISMKEHHPTKSLFFLNSLNSSQQQ